MKKGPRGCPAPCLEAKQGHAPVAAGLGTDLPPRWEQGWVTGGDEEGLGLGGWVAGRRAGVGRAGDVSSVSQADAGPRVRET